MSGRPTLKDVARLAGVSFKTVSRVVNGEPGVAPETAAKVQHAVNELGYERNHGAQALRRTDQRAYTIGVVHADIANPFSAAVHAALERVASDNDTLVLSGSSGGDATRQDRLIAAFVARRVDGLAIIPTGEAPGKALRRELERRTPTVFIDREPGAEADTVLSDHRGGADTATRHLLDHGHRHIGFLGSREATTSTQQRRRGFDDALRSIERTVSTVRGDLTSVSQAEQAVHDLFADRGAAPTALFAAQNLAATGAVRALHQLGLQHEVALVAFDHIDIADMVDPGITTVPQNADRLGQTAAELLFDRISGGSRPARRVVVPVGLVVRGSGEIAPPPPR